jgi:hypothetical protein
MLRHLIAAAPPARDRPGGRSIPSAVLAPQMGRPAAGPMPTVDAADVAQQAPAGPTVIRSPAAG